MNQVDHRIFHSIIKTALESNSRINDMLTLYKLSEYEQFKCFLSGDLKSGYALNNGELISVFSLVKGRGISIVKHAITQGGYKLDCFDGYLVKLYYKCGFNEVKRELNWVKGEPDVVYMCNYNNI